MKIKICGLRREEDIVCVNKLKPDYVGFIFAKSKRQVTVSEAKKLVGNLDKDIKKVGVFVNSDIKIVKNISEICSLDILQFHGDETSEYINKFQQETWKSFNIKDKNSLDELNNYKVDGYLLDSFVHGERGGTGKAFDWELINLSKREKFIILAGGLCFENISLGIEKISPNVVDINSGVEINGYKDFNKMKKIIKKVRE